MSFSTANESAFQSKADVRSMQFLSNSELDDLFEAVVECVEEAVIDSMIANESMTGRGGCTIQALPHARLLELLSRAGDPSGADAAYAEAIALTANEAERAALERRRAMMGL